MANALKNKDYRFFEMARKEALESDFSNIHVGCIITYKGRVIGSGHNTKKTCPTQKKANKYRNFKVNGARPSMDCGHAEIMAWRSIPYTMRQTVNFRQCNVYVYRICNGKKLGFGLARPCSGCMKTLRDKGFQNFYYTTEDGFGFERIF